MLYGLHRRKKSKSWVKGKIHVDEKGEEPLRKRSVLNPDRAADTWAAAKRRSPEVETRDNQQRVSQVVGVERPRSIEREGAQKGRQNASPLRGNGGPIPGLKSLQKVMKGEAERNDSPQKSTAPCKRPVQERSRENFAEFETGREQSHRRKRQESPSEKEEESPPERKPKKPGQAVRRTDNKGEPNPILTAGTKPNTWHANQCKC